MPKTDSEASAARSDINDIISRFRKRSQTPEQVKWCADLFAEQIEILQNENAKLRNVTTPATLLHGPTEGLPEGCYCQPGRCMAPIIMGMQMECRDPQKAQASAALTDSMERSK